MIKLLVIADDFTGAQDTGVKFSQKGISTIVTTRIDIDLHIYGKNIEVLVVDTESRHISKEEAAQKVSAITKKAIEYGVEYIYKKTDSTLRGNLGAELVACMDAAGCDNLMFIPAYPQTGRTTVKGFQYLNGIPLNETVFAKDPLEPIDTAYIPDLIARQSDIKVTALIYDNIKDTDSYFQDKNCIYIFDSSSNEDLVNIGSYLQELKKLKVTAGCAGFADVLSDLIKFSKTELKPERKEGCLFTVCGSVNKVSAKQIKFAQERGYTVIPLYPEQILEKDYFRSQSGKTLISNIASDLHNNKKLIIKTEGRSDDSDRFIEYAQKIGLPKDKLHIVIAESLGKLVAELLKIVKIGNLIVFGGDTALGIMDAISCNGAVVKEEITAGAPISEIISKDYYMNIITKAGGFGEDDILLKIEDYISRI